MKLDDQFLWLSLISRKNEKGQNHYHFSFLRILVDPDSPCQKLAFSNSRITTKFLVLAQVAVNSKCIKLRNSGSNTICKRGKLHMIEKARVIPVFRKYM